MSTAISGREFKAIVNILNNGKFSGQVCVSEGFLWVLDPYFSARISILDNDDNGVFDNFQNARLDINKNNSKGVSVSDIVYIYDDGSWETENGKLVSSANGMDHGLFNGVKSLFGKETYEADVCKLALGTFKQISNLLDGFKMIAPAAIKFVLNGNGNVSMVKGHCECSHTKPSKGVEHALVSIDFIAAAHA